MDLAWLGLAFLGGMLVLIALGVPIAFAILITGIVGMLVVGTINQAQGQLMLNVWDRGTSFVLTTIPLYILMGQLVYLTRIASDLYEAVYKWLGWLTGGIAMTSVVACAGFDAVSGGSATAVATLGPMCMPEMESTIIPTSWLPARSRPPAHSASSFRRQSSWSSTACGPRRRSATCS